MLPVDGKTLLILLFVSIGAFSFLHLVAKEKHRREKWLEFRLAEQAAWLEENRPSTGKIQELSEAQEQDGGNGNSDADESGEPDDSSTPENSADQPTVLKVVSSPH